MEVIVAKTAGFCFGVKRAVEQVYEQIAKVLQYLLRAQGRVRST